MVRHDFGRRRVKFGIPGELGAKDFLNSQSKASIASAELGVGHRHVASFGHKNAALLAAWLVVGLRVIVGPVL